MKTTRYLLFFLLAFALVAILVFTWSLDIAREDEMLEQVETPREEVVIRDIPALYSDDDVIVYTTAKSHFLLSAPDDLTVLQLDAGGVSQVFVQDDAGVDLVTVVLRQSSTFEGIPLSFDAWVQEELVAADYISTCENVLFGEVLGSCFRVQESSAETIRYFGVGDIETFFVVEVPLSLFDRDAVQYILQKLQFGVTADDSAVVIE